MFPLFSGYPSTTRCLNPEDHDMNFHQFENLNSQKSNLLSLYPLRSFSFKDIITIKTLTSSSVMKSINNNSRHLHHRLQRLGLLTCSGLDELIFRSLRWPTSLSSSLRMSQTASEEFDYLAFLQYVLKHTVRIPLLFS
jgi:hypothetical protein